MSHHDRFQSFKKDNINEYIYFFKKKKLLGGK